MDTHRYTHTHTMSKHTRAHIYNLKIENELVLFNPGDKQNSTKLLAKGLKWEREAPN